LSEANYRFIFHGMLLDIKIISNMKNGDDPFF